jgi:hypothetical protein
MQKTSALLLASDWVFKPFTILKLVKMIPIYTKINTFVAGLLLLTTITGTAQTFTSQVTTTFPNIPNAGRNIIADFDGDGDADILSQTAIAAGSPFTYTKSNGNGTFAAAVAQSSSPFAGLTLPDVVTFPLYRTDDFDADGDIDIWVPVNAATGLYFRNDGSTFSSQPTTTFPAAQFTARNIVADFDGDGDADILYQTGVDGTAFMYAQNNGNGTFAAAVAQSSSPFAGLTLPNASQLSTYRTADFDGDGDIDLWATAGSSTGTYFRNDGSSFSLQSSATFPAPQFMGRSVIGDFDADGDADILYQLNGDGTAFSYAQSNGNGTFTIVTQASSPFASLSLDNISTFGFYRTNDFDGDGDLDIWMSGNGTTGTALLSQNGAPPKLTTTSPINDAAGVERNSSIVLNFSEAVTKGTGLISIVNAATNVIVESIPVTSGQVTGSGTSWIINPSVTLPANTTFNIKISGGAFLDVTSTEFPGILGAQFQFTTGVVLPLFWLSTNAVYENDQVNIHWKTTGELNTAHFEIERSFDGTLYNSIGQVASANISGEHQYAFADNGVQHGYTYYYRLKQVDIDGRFNYSSTLQVEIGGERAATLKIRNNAVQSDMVVAITLPQAKSTRMIVVNQAGATVLERKENLQAGETIMTVRTSNLPRGIYYLVLYAGRDKLSTSLIKQ